MMFVLMMIIAGMAVALAVYFLLSGIFSFEPQMSVTTVDYFGVLPSVLLFAICGPVLVLKLWFQDDGLDDDQRELTGFLITGVVALFWSGTLGLVATHSLAAAIAPAVASL